MAKATLGVIIGNRDFFPDPSSPRPRDILALFAALEVEVILLDEDDTKLGAVETWQHAKACADLFRRHRDEIDGVLVCLPNFGDEKGVADTLELAGWTCRCWCRAIPTTSTSSTSSGAATRSAARSRSATTCASTASRSR